jgi:hypothetical protein
MWRFEFVVFAALCSAGCDGAGGSAELDESGVGGAAGTASSAGGSGSKVPCDADATHGFYYRDLDADGLGDPTDGVSSCTAIEGRVSNNRDCDDSDPDAPEDNVDADGDLYPVECKSKPGRGLASYDCDDSNAEIHPSAEEVALDGIDSDCDGLDAPILLDCSTLPAYDASVLQPRSECDGLSDLVLVAISDCWGCGMRRLEVVVGNRSEMAVEAKLSLGDPSMDVALGVLPPLSLSGMISIETDALPFPPHILSVLPTADVESCPAADSSHVMTYWFRCEPF